MAEDFYPFTSAEDHVSEGGSPATEVRYATRIAVYDDMLSTPRVIVIDPADTRTYLEEVTNTVYRAMRDQGGRISLMVIRELVENFIHARFCEPVVSILDDGNTVRFADQGPGIEDKERAFEFGITSANQEQKRYIRGTGAGLPMVEQYLENAGGAISIEDNLNTGTVVTVSIDPSRVQEINRSVSRGAVVRGFSTPSNPTYPQPDHNDHQFSTNQQSLQKAVVSSAKRTDADAASGPSQQLTRAAFHISKRGVLALLYLAEHDSAGPTELAATYGESTPTWSRELATLSSIGLVVKQGQKRVLTEVGRMWVEEHR